MFCFSQKRIKKISFFFIHHTTPRPAHRLIKVYNKKTLFSQEFFGNISKDYCIPNINNLPSGPQVRMVTGVLVKTKNPHQINDGGKPIIL
jgi:hypothetical protein